MRVSRLKLANLRVIEEAEFRFRPGFNLVAGVNGVGKTSVLDALGVCLSAIVKQANGIGYRARTFSPNDLRVGAEALTAECEVELDGAAYTYLVHNPCRIGVRRRNMPGNSQARVRRRPARAEFVGDAPSRSAAPSNGRPLAVLFATRRASASAREPLNLAAAGGIAAACSDAFASRELRLGEFAAWLRVQRTMAVERPAAWRVLDAFRAAVSRFLPGYSDLRIDGDAWLNLLIDRNDISLPVAQLSDGERGVLAMVLDLTRRLAQANPEMRDPAAEAEAVVLIDEIELHLHPAWQRRIVGNLTETFPKCQFIATTHSPQVIGEVTHDRIHIIADGEAYSPDRSFGVDSSRILEEIMGADPRTKAVKALLSEISRTIGEDRYDDARALLRKLSCRLGENDPEVTRIRTLLDFMTDDA